MKAVIFCGGRGTRIRDVTQDIPKPMIQLGDKPILWHIMRHYSHWGHEDFILCLGYKGHIIKDFFWITIPGPKISLSPLKTIRR